MKNLTGILDRILHNNMGGVCYRKPESERLTCLLPHKIYSGKSLVSETRGFLIYPFTNPENAVYLPFSDAEVIYLKIDIREPLISSIPQHIKWDEREKNIHLDLVSKGVNYIRGENAHKIVLSHRFEMPSTGLRIEDYFKNLLLGYPEAFVYFWKHPRGQIWMGATPERLFSSGSHEYQTMALAGTLGKPEEQWGEKEYEEHKWVVEHILQKLSPFSLEISQAKTEEIQAGPIRHLRTLINGRLIPGMPLFKMIEELHPTPAVCGTPTDKAREYILAHETYPREYYTGFLGEWDSQGFTDLYVNLRCIQLKKNKLYFYAGGGITADSHPEKEWDEINRKVETMSNMLVY
jgi:isochorismate synthase